jgi:arginine/ornithine transport system substrate-binding protein
MTQNSRLKAAITAIVSTAVAAMLLLGMTLPAEAQKLKLKLGNEGDYPPFSITEGNGHLTGMEPELARAMCAKLDADCEIQAMDFAALLPSLISGKIDMIVSQLAPLPERLNKTDFTVGLISNPAVFVAPISWTMSFDEKALEGKKIGAIKGSSKETYLEKVLTKANGVFYDNIQQIKLDLEAGRLDLGMEGKLTIAYKFLTGADADKWKMSDPPVPRVSEVPSLGDIPQSWAVQKGNKELLEKVNAALEALIADCSYTKIRKRFLPVQTISSEPASCQ